MQALVDDVVKRFGRLDILINDAAYNKSIAFKDLDNLTYEEWTKIIDINLTGPMLLTKAVAPVMKKQGSGRIVNISSVAGLGPTGSSIAYAVSKAGVVQLTRALALALAPEVRVNSVSPGLVSSRWFSSRFGDEAAAAQEEAFAKQTPVQKIATPDDVARAVIALLENDLITGQDLVVDGGKNVLYQALI